MQLGEADLKFSEVPIPFAQPAFVFTAALDLPVLLASTVNPESPVTPGALVNQASMASTSHRRLNRPSRASSVPQGHPGREDHRVSPAEAAPGASLDILVCLAELDNLDLLGHLALLENLETKVIQVKRDRLETTLLVALESLDPVDLRDPEDPRDPPDSKESHPTTLESLEFLDLKDQRDHLESADHTAPKDLSDPQGSPGIPVAIVPVLAAFRRSSLRQ